MPGSALENWYWDRRYLPYEKEDIERLLVAMMKAVPRYCRVMRVMREIPPEYIVAGTTRIDLRKEIEKNLRKSKTSLKEIRYREVGFALRHGEINPYLMFKSTEYKASDGEEYFLEIVNPDDVLFGLLRLRVFGKNAIVRELHVYGQALKIGEKNKTVAQHRGFGRWLVEEAEIIARKSNCKKISIISGVGVRDYYRKLGYELEGTYMVKIL
jgi:elongator complex protein 3